MFIVYNARGFLLRRNMRISFSFNPRDAPYSRNLYQNNATSIYTLVQYKLNFLSLLCMEYIADNKYKYKHSSRAPIYDRMHHVTQPFSCIAANHTYGHNARPINILCHKNVFISFWDITPKNLYIYTHSRLDERQRHDDTTISGYEK